MFPLSSRITTTTTDTASLEYKNKAKVHTDRQTGQEMGEVLEQQTNWDWVRVKVGLHFTGYA